jgi:RHS repeat-associated protein
VVNKYANTPFGVLAGIEESIRNPFKYVGKFGVMDDENGLLYMRARYYDPHIDKFLTQDPIGFLGGLNLYTYVVNNPVNLIDPLGSQWSPSDAVLPPGWNIPGGPAPSLPLGGPGPWDSPYKQQKFMECINDGWIFYDVTPYHVSYCPVEAWPAVRPSKVAPREREPLPK